MNINEATTDELVAEINRLQREIERIDPMALSVVEFFAPILTVEDNDAPTA